MGWQCVWVVLLVLLCSARLGYRQYYGRQDCEMTYMWQRPRYQEVPLPPEMKAQYPQYGLYLYYERPQPVESLLLPLRGVPALFLPGNAGSYKQARSSASIALRMKPSDFPATKHFDFFTIDFNEELSGMFGGILQTQTDYVVKSIQRILSLYEGVKPRPKSVVIVGHSMGGVIARAIFSHPEFNHSTVNTIIALSSPLLQPVLTFDRLMEDYYSQVHAVWSEPSAVMSEVTLVSISGGERDVMVPTHLSIVPTALNLASPAVPRNWASADHLAVVWCRRVQLAVTRALFQLQSGGRELTSNSSERRRVFRQLLLRGKEIPSPDDAQLHVKARDIVFVNKTEFYREGASKGNRHVAIPLPPRKDHTPSSRLLLVSNTERSAWLHICSPSSDQDTLTCKDLSSQCSLLPPKDAVLKVMLLDVTQLSSLLPGATHLLVSSPSRAKRFVKVQQCEDLSSLALPWLRTSLKLASGHCSLTNLSLPHLTQALSLTSLQVWQAYRVEAWSHCGGVAGGLVVPWYPQPSLSNSTLSPLTLSLSLLAPPPPDQATPPPPYLLLWSSAECELELKVTPDPLVLLDKLAIIHAPLLLPWVAGLCVSGSNRRLRLELLLIVSFQVIITARTDWLLGSWDWVELYPLWSGCGPVLLHLLACGLQQFLYKACSVVSRAYQASLGPCCGHGFSLVLLGASILLLWFCSSLSLILATFALLPQAKSKRMKEVTCVMVCWILLTLPALFTWVRAMRFSLQLFPDPHWSTVMGSLPLLFLLLSYDHISPCKRESGAPPGLVLTESALGMAIVCGCLSHAYRMVPPILLYLLLRVVHNYFFV